MSEPTFVIAGGQRCGTTWLYHLLDEHPQIWLAKPVRPEPKFFLEDPEPGRDRDWYLQTWFADADPAAVARGEKSTSYIEDPQAPHRMRALFPDLRAVFILRHPVERAISNYCFTRQHGLETETFAAAIRMSPASRHAAGTSVNPFAYLERGHYDDAIARYLEILGADRVHVVVREQLRDDPDSVLPALFRFLGADPDFVPTGLATTHNEASWHDLTLSQPLLDELLATFATSNRRLEVLCGVDVRAWDEPTETLRQLVQ